VSWMTLTGSIVGFLSLGGIIGAYAYGMVADRRALATRGRRDYLQTDEGNGGHRRAA